ncbi:hypothetical protein, partial [Shinella sp.]|uniref:hypothetical protein n=1 Tax=Shinella sp. TaxID=1870904 RepID=UPI003F729B36
MAVKSLASSRAWDNMRLSYRLAAHLSPNEPAKAPSRLDFFKPARISPMRRTMLATTESFPIAGTFTIS